MPIFASFGYQSDTSIYFFFNIGREIGVSWGDGGKGGT